MFLFFMWLGYLRLK